MRPNLRSKRTYTEVEQPSEQQLRKPKTMKHINVQDIKFDSENMTDQNRRRLNNNYFPLNQRRLKAARANRLHLNRRQLPNRLPALIGQDTISFEEQVNVKHEKNKKNVTLLNAIIDILKTNQGRDLETKSQYKFEEDRKNRLYEDKRMSEFSEFNGQNSTKNYRGPRIIETQITKLTNNTIIRRRIASQEKSRPKYYEQQKKQKQKRQHTFDGIQILTFSNKFPGLHKTQSKANKHQPDNDANEFMD